MNKKTSLLIGIAVMISFIFCGCRYNSSNNSENTTDSLFADSNRQLVIKVENAVISGKVKDREGNPLSGVLVSSGELTVQSNEEGFFTLNRLKTVNSRSVINFEKEGYFQAIRSIELSDEEYIELMMQPYGNSEFSLQSSFNLTKEQTFSIGKMKIHLPAGALVDSLGNVYTNTAYANLLYLDPTTKYFSSMMPGGDLAAVRTNGEESILLSYGMVKVELKDVNGNKLQLQKGKTAIAEFPVPAAMEQTAPDTIPLWFFNEETGVWEEEGFAPRQGELFVGELPHFSWWNVDYPYLRQEINGNVTDCNGEPVACVKVTTDQTYSYTNSKGRYRVYVPREMTSTLTIAKEDYYNYGDVISYNIEAQKGGTVFSKDLTLPCISLEERKRYVENLSEGQVIIMAVTEDGEEPVVMKNSGIASNNATILNAEIEIVDDVDDYDAYINPEKMPAFQGDLNAWLMKNILYPQIARNMNVQENIVVSFIIETDGSITGVNIEKGNDASLRREAIRLVKSMPNWIPGEQDGRKVRTKYMLPINFKLL
jgi:TonB family protein